MTKSRFPGRRFLSLVRRFLAHWAAWGRQRRSPALSDEIRRDIGLPPLPAKAPWWQWPKM